MKFSVVSVAVLLGWMVPGALPETISWDKVPPTVQKTIHDRLAKATIGTVEREEENGEVSYTIEITIANQARDYTLDEEGRIVRVQVFLRELPGAVQKGIQNIAGQGTIETIEKVLEDEGNYYDVTWKKKDGAEHSFHVWESGAVKSVQISLAECPSAVQATVLHEAGEAKVKEIAKTFEDNATHYVATIDRDGKNRDLTIAETGQLLRMDSALEETPAPVRKTIDSFVGKGRIVSLDKVFEDGAVEYDIEWKTQENAAHSFTVLESGKLKSVQISIEETPSAVRAALIQAIGKGKWKDLTKSYGDDGITYDVTLLRGGKDRDMSFAESGQLVRTELEIAETPPPVQKGIQNYIGKGMIVNIERAVEDGHPQFNIDWKTREGAAHTFSLLENGNMKSVGVSLEETPPAVNAAILQEAGSGKWKEIEKSFDEHAVAYDVTVTRDGRERDFTVTENGQLERRQLFLEELAAAPQGTIKRITNGGMVLRIDQVFEKGGFHMEVESLIDGKRYDFNVGQNGLFLGVTQ
jgi:uncharacterized membrane protein YkoI